MFAALPIFGEIEELVSELYPYRYVITPLLVVAAAGVALLAFRRGLHLLLWRHRLASAVLGAPLLAVSLVAGGYLLSPLWERSFLDEASPLAAIEAANVGPGTSAASQPSVRTPARPAVTHRGSFVGADAFHFGRGDALLIRSEGGGTLLRFENFSVRNGPDLYVYLSRDESGRRVEESLNLGRLKATDGAFNYEVPAGIDLAGVRSVVVWCRQFAVQFAAARLTPN